MNAVPRQSISDRIRELAAAGHSRADIARMVDRSYQQVRQVLVADEARARRTAQRTSVKTPETAAPGGLGEPKSPAYQALPEPRPARLQVDVMGRVQLPADWRVPAGAVFIARNFHGSIVLMDVSQASEAARIASMDYGSDALIAERRLEAMREFDD
jgi:hypothetical protein